MSVRSIESVASIKSALTAVTLVATSCTEIPVARFCDVTTISSIVCAIKLLDIKTPKTADKATRVGALAIKLK